MSQSDLGNDDVEKDVLLISPRIQFDSGASSTIGACCHSNRQT